MHLRDDQAVLVTGAAGFLGKDLVARLLDRGWRVRALLRPGKPAPFPAHERLEKVIGDMTDAASLRAPLTGVAAVVHLAARTGDQPDSDDVNVGGALRLVDACRTAGCRRVVNMSTQSTKIPRKGVYARTKGDADEVFHSAGLDVTSLLPSIIYGEERGGVFGTLLRFVQKLPVVPVLGNGTWRSAPVYIGDVSEAVSACLQTEATIGKKYDIAGPDVISFDALIDRLAAELGMRARKVHIPFALALLGAKVVTKLLPRPPITVSNVLGSNQDTVIDTGPARRDFGFDPLDLDTGIKAVLGKIANPRALPAAAR